MPRPRLNSSRRSGGDDDGDDGGDDGDDGGDGGPTLGSCTGLGGINWDMLLIKLSCTVRHSATATETFHNIIRIS